VDSAATEREAIRRLVRELGAAGGERAATPEEIRRLRDFFAHRVLRSYVDDYIHGKYDQHVGIDGHWPDDTTAEEYLESLRETVLDPSSALYLTNDGGYEDWSVYFVGRVRRAWRGRHGSNRIVVLFNGEQHRFVTGFQPQADDEYVDRQGGFWLYRR